MPIGTRFDVVVLLESRLRKFHLKQERPFDVQENARRTVGKCGNHIVTQMRTLWLFVFHSRNGHVV